MRVRWATRAQPQCPLRQRAQPHLPGWL